MSDIDLHTLRAEAGGYARIAEDATFAVEQAEDALELAQARAAEAKQDLANAKANEKTALAAAKTAADALAAGEAKLGHIVEAGHAAATVSVE